MIILRLWTTQITYQVYRVKILAESLLTMCPLLTVHLRISHLSQYWNVLIKQLSQVDLTVWVIFQVQEWVVLMINIIRTKHQVIKKITLVRNQRKVIARDQMFKYSIFRLKTSIKIIKPYIHRTITIQHFKDKDLLISLIQDFKVLSLHRSKR